MQSYGWNPRCLCGEPGGQGYQDPGTGQSEKEIGVLRPLTGLANGRGGRRVVDFREVAPFESELEPRAGGGTPGSSERERHRLDGQRLGLIGSRPRTADLSLRRAGEREQHRSGGQAGSHRAACVMVAAVSIAPAGSRTATAAKMNFTRSATLTVPPGPARTGVIPKSVCLTENSPSARSVSPSIRTLAFTGTFRVWPTIVSSPSRRKSVPDTPATVARKRISGNSATLSTCVRMVSVTLRISAVSSGVRTARLSVGMTTCRRDSLGLPVG